MEDPINPRAVHKKKCKGWIFRAHVNAFINKRGQYIYRESMTPLKRQSCPGCEDFDTPCSRRLEEDLSEFVSDGVLPIMEDIVDDALYELIVVNESTDWETGRVDDWDLEFRRIEK